MFRTATPQERNSERSSDASPLLRYTPPMRPVVLCSLSLALLGCPTGPNPLDYDLQALDASDDQPEPTGPFFCATGTNVDGAVVPTGFCTRRFATIGAPRVLNFAPNGDLFVSSPSQSTDGGAPPGLGQIVVLSDDNHDGIAEAHVFLGDVPTVHGIAIAGGFLYYTTSAAIFRTPYIDGQRVASGPGTMVASYPMVPGERWTHGFTRSAAGTLYSALGVYSATTCPDTPRLGQVFRADVGGALTMLSTGYRNPMYLRCHFRDEACIVAELGDDGGGSQGARERMVLLRDNTNYGFPCCTGRGRSTTANHNVFDCNSVPQEEAEFPLNDTPFGMDWERGRWPAPFRDAIFVALHGSFYTVPRWQGTRIVFAETDPATHAPRGSWNSFVLGFGQGGGPLERATDVVFSSDGRMFFADDQGGGVYWVAPANLRSRW